MRQRRQFPLYRESQEAAFALLTWFSYQGKKPAQVYPSRNLSLTKSQAYCAAGLLRKLRIARVTHCGKTRDLRHLALRPYEQWKHSALIRVNEETLTLAQFLEYVRAENALHELSLSQAKD